MTFGDVRKSGKHFSSPLMTQIASFTTVNKIVYVNQNDSLHLVIKMFNWGGGERDICLVEILKQLHEKMINIKLKKAMWSFHISNVTTVLVVQKSWYNCDS